MRRLAAHWGLFGGCAVFLLVGALAFDDHGLWWDEPALRAYANVAIDYVGGDGEHAFDQVITQRKRRQPSHRA